MYSLTSQLYKHCNCQLAIIMGKCCIVVCTSEGKSNSEKVSRFAVPYHPELSKKWSNVPKLNYVVNDKLYVCEKSFYSRRNHYSIYLNSKPTNEVSIQ